MANDVPRELAADEALSADWLNQLVRFVAANRLVIDPSSGLIGTSGPNGRTIGFHDTPDTWIRLTYAAPAGAGGGSYSWVEQIAAAGGAWDDGFRKGYAASDPGRGAVPPDPAWEASLNRAAALGSVVLASRDAAVGRLTFRSGSCS